uniref:Uncharacterized protein n=1 Tax=Glossina pallidipes TaxID=7398 RepID=A0A1A9Z9U5_GLOPL
MDDNGIQNHFYHVKSNETLFSILVFYARRNGNKCSDDSLKEVKENDVLFGNKPSTHHITLTTSSSSSSGSRTTRALTCTEPCLSAGVKLPSVAPGFGTSGHAATPPLAFV